MPHHWTLYGTTGCHLCEQAQAIVAQLQQEFAITLTQVDIAEGEQAAQWVQLFGERIPVLENTDQGVMLDWPFDVDTLCEWLGSA